MIIKNINNYPLIFKQTTVDFYNNKINKNILKKCKNKTIY
jgi:hypothetical protein